MSTAPTRTSFLPPRTRMSPRSIQPRPTSGSRRSSVSTIPTTCSPATTTSGRPEHPSGVRPQRSGRTPTPAVDGDVVVAVGGEGSSLPGGVAGFEVEAGGGGELVDLFGPAVVHAERLELDAAVGEGDRLPDEGLGGPVVLVHADRHRLL